MTSIIESVLVLYGFFGGMVATGFILRRKPGAPFIVQFVEFLVCMAAWPWILCISEDD